MYSRPQRQDLRVPHNYSGSIFDSRPTPPTPVEDLTHRRPPSEARESNMEKEHLEENLGYAIPEPKEQENQPDDTSAEKPSPLLSAFGSLGSEEILLIILALIVFQGGKDPELGLILLALLFIN